MFWYLLGVHSVWAILEPLGEAKIGHVVSILVILGTQMGAKSKQGRLWDPIVPPGGPLSAQGCHVAG